MTAFNTNGRVEALQRLKTYLGGAAADGGVAVVVGPRGSGKTRLVDYALNQHDDSDVGLCCGDGRPSWRWPLQVTREPRKLKRYVLKVEVTPPASAQDARPSDAKNTHVDTDRPEDMSAAILDRMVMELTSQVDPRPSTRRHGKTLRARLGWTRYWFSPTALVTPTRLPPSVCLAGLALVYVMAAVCFVSYAHYQPWAWVTVMLLGPPAWMFLRWRDWQGVIRMTGRLYDLSHAEQVRRVTGDTPGSDAGDRVRNVVAEQMLGLLITVIGGSVTTGGLWFTNKDNQWDVMAWLVGLGVVLVMFGLVSMVRGTMHPQRSEFGGENPAWKITQLRRLLFLLHRCGIEPVLVFDELDKYDSIPSRRSVPEPDPGERYPQLRQFIEGLALLKLNVGAHFLILLIGDIELWNFLDTERGKHPFGPLSTLIREEIVIGPISWKNAAETLRDMSAEQKSPSASPPKTENDNKLIWLLAQGLFFQMHRLVREREAIQFELEAEAVETLEKVASELWDGHALLRNYGFIGDADDVPAGWIPLLRLGVMRLIYELIAPGIAPLTHENMTEKSLPERIFNARRGDINEIKMLGMAAAYQALIERYRDGGWGIVPAEEEPAIDRHLFGNLQHLKLANAKPDASTG